MNAGLCTLGQDFHPAHGISPIWSITGSVRSHSPFCCTQHPPASPGHRSRLSCQQLLGGHFPPHPAAEALSPPPRPLLSSRLKLLLSKSASADDATSRGMAGTATAAVPANAGCRPGHLRCLAGGRGQAHGKGFWLGLRKQPKVRRSRHAAWPPCFHQLG